MNIRPIKTEADYAAALAEIERLFEAKPHTPEGDRSDVLTTLVEANEDEHHPMPAPDPVEAIRYGMESRGLAAKDLSPCLGSGQRAREVLRRKRPLTMEMIRRLHAGLGISADVLIQRYRLTPQRSELATRDAFEVTVVVETHGTNARPPGAVMKPFASSATRIHPAAVAGGGVAAASRRARRPVARQAKWLGVISGRGAGARTDRCASACSGSPPQECLPPQSVRRRRRLRGRGQ
jgi:HTH-type transcriptional regulator/antitoxin HigA